MSWCSWLSRQSNTLKVSGSSPGDANFSLAFYLLTLNFVDFERQRLLFEDKINIWVLDLNLSPVITSKGRIRRIILYMMGKSLSILIMLMWNFYELIIYFRNSPLFIHLVLTLGTNHFIAFALPLASVKCGTSVRN